MMFEPVLTVAVCDPTLNDLALTRATVRQLLDALPLGRRIAVHAYPAPENLLAAPRCDVVITELDLGQMNGFKLIEEVRRRRPGAAAILMTGIASSETALQARQEQVELYFIKPLSGGEDYERLRHTLEMIVRLLVPAAAI